MTMNGEKHGPFGRDVLKAIAKSGNLNPRIDRVWHAGMEDWVLAGEVQDLFERADPAKAAKQATKEEKKEKKAAAATPGYAAAEEYQVNYEYQWPGIGRLGYWFGPLFFTVLIFGLIAATQIFADRLPAAASEKAPLAMAGVWVLMIVLVMLQRFTNLGMSKWWFLGLLIPGVNVWLHYRLLACPPGYGPNRKMDGIGWVLAVLFWFGILGSTVTSVMTLKNLSPQFQADWQDPEKREQIISRIASGAWLDEMKSKAEEVAEKLESQQADAGKAKADP